MIYWGTPRFVMRFLKNFMWHGDRNKKTIYLTFDDGPTPGITEQVLDILGRYEARATFFCLGRNADRHPGLLAQITSRGHAIGNHTYSHLKGWKTSLKTYIQDTFLARQHIESALFRPPYGRITSAQAKYIGKDYRLVMWDVLTHDYNQRIPKRMCLRNVIRSTKNGSIVVFHDSIKASGNMLYVLPRFIEHFSSKGYKFERIEL
ncbi:MAG: polysaccharide deacetylase family protein [Bacteroidales bacterium]|nr:polysaccharide deacetylase family protein [Bacteroidales bacterium]